MTISQLVVFVQNVAVTVNNVTTMVVTALTKHPPPAKPSARAELQNKYIFRRLKDLLDFTCMIADKFSKDAKVKLTLFQKIGQKTFRRLRHRQFCEKRMKNLGYETMLDERKIGSTLPRPYLSPTLQATWNVSALHPTFRSSPFLRSSRSQEPLPPELGKGSPR